MSAVIAEGYMDEGVVRLEPRLVRIESGVAGLDDRVERVEKRLEQIDGKMDRLDERVTLIDRRLVVVEVNSENIKENLGKLEVGMRDMRQSMDQKFASSEERFERAFGALDKKSDDRFESLQGELRALTRLLIGVVITFFTTLIGFGAALLEVLARALHWLK